MKRKLPEDIAACCGLCEFARKVDISNDILCAKTKHLKKVSSDYVCRKFSFDILAYKPNPAKLPKFAVESPEDIL